MNIKMNTKMMNKMMNKMKIHNNYNKTQMNLKLIMSNN